MSFSLDPRALVHLSSFNESCHRFTFALFTGAEYINIPKEKQNSLITRFKTNTIYKILWPLSKRNRQETQSIGIHDMLKGLESIIGRFQTWSAFCEFSDVTESFTAKEEDGLTSYLILNVLEAKIFRYNFMEGHNV